MNKCCTIAALILSFWVVQGAAVHAQATQRTCAAHTHYLQQIAEDADFEANSAAIEAYTYRFERTPSVHSRSAITIPVVVHIVWRNLNENIPTVQIESQIAQLNRDFNLENSEATQIPSEFQALAANCNIRFCLAKRDPQGNATDGIQRIFTTKPNFTTNNDVKRSTQGGSDAWNTAHYLNIWVCSLVDGSLGYAQFPGGQAATDGVVIDYRYFGTQNTFPPFNLGRTATHEVGHWLNLQHIWGDALCGDDRVSDTPPHQSANYGCPTVARINNTCAQNTREMTMNFMDYTSDACMYMFTNGQKMRMLALFAAGGARASMLESQGAIAPPTPCFLPTNVIVSNVNNTSVQVQFDRAQNAQNYRVEYKKNADTVWTIAGINASNTFIINNLSAATKYNLRFKSLCSNSESSYGDIKNFNTQSSTMLQNTPPSVCLDTFESNNTLRTAKKIDIDRPIYAQLGWLGDRDFFYFSTPDARDIFVALGQLPADYDMRIYNKQGKIVAFSENLDKINEQIRLKTNRNDTFYVEIYGYNGAYKAAACYSLSVTNVYAQEQISPKSLKNAGENSRALAFDISPNPSSEGFTRLAFQPEYDFEATVSITNLSGQIVLNTRYEVSKMQKFIEIALPDLPEGVYIVLVKDHKMNISGHKKLLVTH